MVEMGLENLAEVEQIGIGDLGPDEDRADGFELPIFARSPNLFVNVDYGYYTRMGGVLTEPELKVVTSQIPTHSQIKAARASLHNGEIPRFDLQHNRLYANIFSVRPDVPQSLLLQEVEIIAPRIPQGKYKYSQTPVQELMGIY